MKPDDIRLSTYDLRQTFKIDPDAPWPRPGDVTAIVATAVAPPPVPAQPSIRAIVLNPSRYLDQKVTITGQFSGRNLLGDMPDAPGKSRYDFVLRSTRRGDLGDEHAAEGEGRKRQGDRARPRRADRHRALADS